MPKEDYPVTTAIRMLREKGVPFKPFVYEYEEKGGTKQFSELFAVPENKVIKTLVFESDPGEIILALMHGDREVSAKELARVAGFRHLNKCDEKKATNATGYLFGGTSPFGTRKKLKIFIEESIFGLDKIYINGGKRGFIIEIESHHLNILENVSIATFTAG